MRRRAGAAVALAAAATWLASFDHRGAWTAVVGVVSAGLAGLAVWERYARDRPPAAEREQAEVDAILWRYERQRRARERERRGR